MKKIVEYKNKYKNSPVQFRASIWFLFCSLLQKGISVLTTPIFTRLLNTTEYGQYSVFISWMDIVIVIVSLQLFYGVYTQGLIKFDKIRDEYSSSLQGLTLSLVMAWLCIYLLFHDFFNDLFTLTTLQMLAMFILIWTTAVFNFWAAEQRVHYSYKQLVIVTLLVSAAKPLLGILLVTNTTDKVTARVLGLAIVEFFGYFSLFIYQMRKGKKFFSKKIWIYAVKYNIPLIPHYLSQTILNSSDRIIIGNLIGGREAGIYSLAYSIALLMTLFNNALLQTLSPWMYQKIKDKKVEDIKIIAYPALLLIGVLNLLLICFAPEIISFFAPDTYYEAIWVIPSIAMSVYFIFAYSLFANFEFYFEKSKYIVISTCLAAIANIILNYIFINIFGYIAAGYTTLICYIVYAVLHYCFMTKICNYEFVGVEIYNYKILGIISGGFLFIGFIIMFTYTNIILRYLVIISSIIIMIIYRKRIVLFVINFKNKLRK